ncbi:1-acylglycerol-3-phosphate acyltransferase-related [Holotrichia oblita]|uniref:1-acylglycerol-3-phosphate acyltransferase-related n=1 Tax=Holotrichia oblita TaxID=644536 RepID=A0ACB9TBE4_HOLOL|nr:1-acylglycerol-3-phosphate acyltransferase-related [Holotrichia oblita]
MTSRTLTLLFKICFIVSFLVTSLVALAIAILLYFTLRFVNLDLYRKALWYLMVVAYAHVTFVTDWWSLLELNLYMNDEDFRKYFGKEHALLIINHSYDIDWLPLLSICARMNLLGNIKIFIKRSLQYIPILGWSFILSEYVLLYRSYRQDEKIIQDAIRNYATYPYPLWVRKTLLLYPEGTWATEDNLEKSRVYAERMNLAQLKHHLQPRTTGFTTTLKEMRGHIKAIYNVEIAFRRGPAQPSCSNILKGKQLVSDIYIKRISEDDIPTDSLEQERLLREMFQTKDKLRNSYIETGSFFTTSHVPVEGHFKLERPFYIIVVVFFACCSIIVTSLLYWLICLYQVHGFAIPFYIFMAISAGSIMIFNIGIKATVIQN